MAASHAQPAAAGEDPVKALMRSAARIVLAFTSSGPAAQPTAAELHAACEQVDTCVAAGVRSLLERPASACQLVKLLACALRGADTAAGDIARAYLELAQKLADSIYYGSEEFLSKIALAILRTGSLEACGRLLARAPELGLDVALCGTVASQILEIVGCLDEYYGEVEAALHASGLFQHAARLLLLRPASACANVDGSVRGVSGPSASAGPSWGGSGPSNAPAGPSPAAAAEEGPSAAIPPSTELDALAWVLGQDTLHRLAPGPWHSYFATAAALAVLQSLDGGPIYGLPPQAEAAGAAAAAAAFLADADAAADPWGAVNSLRAWAQTCMYLAGDAGCDKGVDGLPYGLSFLPDAGLFRIGLRVVAASLALAERVEVGLEEEARSWSSEEDQRDSEELQSSIDCKRAVRLESIALAAAGAAVAADGALIRLLAAAEGAGGGGGSQRRLAAWWGAAVGAAGAAGNAADCLGCTVHGLRDVAGRLLVCMVERLTMPMPTDGTLPPTPPPGLAVALSAGALPALERLLRRTNGALLLADPCPVLGPFRQPAAALLSWPRLRVLLAYGDVRQAASLVATIGKVLALRPAERDGAGGPGDALVLRTLEVASEGRAWAAALCSRTPQPSAAAGSSGPGSGSSDGGSASAAFSAADAQLLRLVAWMHARWLPAWAAWGSGVARRLAAAPEEGREAVVWHLTAVLAALSYPLDCLPYSIAGVAVTSQTEAQALVEKSGVLMARAQAEVDAVTKPGTAVAAAALVTRHVLLMHEAAATALTAASCSLAANAMALRPPPTTAEAAAEAASVAAWGQVLLGGTAPVMAFLSDVAAAAADGRLATILTAMRNRLRLLLVHYTGPTCSYLSSLAEGGGGDAGSSRTPPPRRLQPFLDVVSSRGPQPDPELEDLLLELRRGPVGEGRPSGPVELPRIGQMLPSCTEQVPSLMYPPPLRVCANGLCGRLEGDSEAFREAALSPCSRGCGVAWFCCAECERAALGEGHGGVCGGGGGAGAR
ncbi:hypothetical protein HYH03_012950 [Edaphochlamys debaryana]|uniref:phytol kinase n=1 Tax=Edaphochlamys debaryana TaxID=47281 RepID=A0A836BUX1_9CHLO|nr:hypothetical protein HYH03_012950 [Edaphochlamys debaryana]|eukprot:KAG2488443.1 hypothetical protein HYH03_012950 [Edaphochlamys debaryana]